jgi:hypothetical protein
MPFALLALALDVAAAETLLQAALERIEPPPALRASFQATITGDGAMRQIAFDPYQAPGERFKVTAARGSSEILDAVVNDWRSEGQADARLFADALRMSLSDVRLAGDAQGWAVQFRHKITPMDGPVDKLIAPRMVGRLDLDEIKGQIRRIDYRIEKPVKLEDGATLQDFRQTYSFQHSARWGVSYVAGYDMSATAGKWGVNKSRAISVRLTDVRFALASDARQELASRPSNMKVAEADGPRLMSRYEGEAPPPATRSSTGQ